MDIGFIGLGQMGFHMARRLVEAGHRLVAFDTRREALDRLTALGAQAAGSTREIVDEVETVMASLPTPEIVLEVATGDKFGRVVLPRAFNLGFTVGLMTKDLKLCLGEGKALGVPMQVAEAVTRLLQLACDENGPDKDLTTVVQAVERRAGVEVRAPRLGGALPK